MSTRWFSNMMYCFRKILYLVVLTTYSVGNCGSYDDYFSAIRVDDVATVKALLVRGFDVNTVDSVGETGLLMAVRQNSLKVAEFLVGWPQTSVEARSLRDESALMLAALKGLSQLCEALIVRGADVNKPGWTPLHYAATNGHLSVINLLLENYAYIDAASPNGTTPLMMAAHYGNPTTVRMLIEAGADPLLKNDQGLSAIDFAQRAQRQDSADIIAAAIRSLQPKGSW